MNVVIDWICKNPLATAIGFLATLLSLIIAIIVPILQRKKKILGYAIKTEPILDANTAKIEGLSIKYKDNDIECLYLTIIKLFNNGNVLIDKKDFYKDKELTITVENGKIIDSHISKQSSDTIEAKLLTNDNSIKVDFVTFEKKDYVTIRLYHTGSDVIVKGRYREGKIVNAIDLSEVKTVAKIFLNMSSPNVSNILSVFFDNENNPQK